MRADLGIRANRCRPGGKRNRLLRGGAHLRAEGRRRGPADIYGQMSVTGTDHTVVCTGAASYLLTDVFVIL